MKNSFLFLYCLFFVFEFYSQHTNFEYFNTDPDGLSQSVVSDIIQDSFGYLWIATHDGLNRFDGDEFKTFYREDGLSFHELECLVERIPGEIWVGTRKGLNVIKNNSVFKPDSLLNRLNFNPFKAEIVDLYLGKNNELN